MKRKLIGISVACLTIAATGSFQARADRVPLAQVPEPVQKAIKQQSQGENLRDVERETKDGQTVYEAEFKRDGLNRRVRFAADGSIIPSKGVADIFNREPSMALSDLPAAVQKTVREQQAGRPIADIDKEMWKGQSLYEVEFKEKGPNSRIYIAPDGSIVMNKSEQGRGGYLGTQLSDTPKAVQDTVKSVAGNAEIADVDTKTKNGNVVYNVEIRQEGLNRHLQIAENGTLLYDTRGGAADLRERVRGAEEKVRSKVAPRDSDKALALNQLPAAVQATVKANGDVTHLKPIKREMNNGRVQYDVEFEKDGKNTRLTISEDGRIIKDNR